MIRKGLLIGENFWYRRPSLPFHEYAKDDLNDFDNFITSAIFFSSSDFFDLLIKKNRNYDEKIKNSLFRYLLRMSTRSVPFGLFSGIGKGKFDDFIIKNDFKKNQLCIEFRLNFSFYKKFIFNETLLKDKQFLVNQTYHLNPTAYLINNKYHYMQRIPGDEFDSYIYSSLVNNIGISSIIDCFTKGKNIGNDILLHLVEEDLTESIEESFDFFEELITCNFICMDLSYEMLNPIFYRSILTACKDKTDVKAMLTLFSDLKTLKVKFDNFSKLHNFLAKQLFSPKSEDLKSLREHIDTNLYFDDKIFLEKNLQSRLKQAFVTLFHYRDDRYNDHYDIKNFISKFYKQFEGQKVSLLQALDPDVGIGFGSYIFQTTTSADFVDFDQSIYKNTENDHRFQLPPSNTEYIETVLSKIKLKTSNLEPDDLKKIPRSMSLCFELLSSDNITQPYLHLKMAGGASALNLSSRFNGSNDILEEYIQEVLNNENWNKDESILFAELSYLPRQVTGSSILNRKNYFDYEIPIFTKSTKDDKTTILLRDLFISINSNMEIVLTHRDGRTVIPRNSTAHSYYNSCPIYHFLSAIQQSSISKHRFYFNFNAFVKNSFCPRVTVNDDIILSLAKWYVNIQNQPKENIKELIFSKKAAHSLPDRVWYFIDVEEKTFIDFDNPLCVELLIKEIEKRIAFKHQYIIFEEYLEPYNPTKTANIYNYEYIASIFNFDNERL